MKKAKDMTLYINLSKRIKDERLNLRLSQMQIADDLGIGYHTYRRYEEGSNEIPLDILLKLSELFNIDINELLGMSIREENEKYKIKENQAIIEKIYETKNKKLILSVDTVLNFLYRISKTE